MVQLKSSSFKISFYKAQIYKAILNILLFIAIFLNNRSVPQTDIFHDITHALKYFVTFTVFYLVFDLFTRNKEFRTFFTSTQNIKKIGIIVSLWLLPLIACALYYFLFLR